MQELPPSLSDIEAIFSGLAKGKDHLTKKDTINLIERLIEILAGEEDIDSILTRNALYSSLDEHNMSKLLQKLFLLMAGNEDEI